MAPVTKMAAFKHTRFNNFAVFNGSRHLYFEIKGINKWKKQIVLNDGNNNSNNNNMLKTVLDSKR
jgi:uncharacterized protein YukJ